MADAIDYDRGVIKRTHSDGVDVYMYRDEPGVFRNAFGNVVSDKIARAAGYDVDRYNKARLLKERMAQAEEVIRREVDSAPKMHEVVREHGDFKVVAVAPGSFHVVDMDDNRLTGMPVPRKVADTLVEQLVGELEPEEAPESEEPEEAKAPKLPLKGKS